MRLLCILGASIIAVSLTGCPDYNRYELKLTPHAAAIERVLTCSRLHLQNGGTSVIAFPADELAKIAKCYERDPDEPQPRQYQFKGNFTAKMPSDIGGSGSYTVASSPVGSVAIYLEHFRGDDDLVGQVERLRQAADRLADLVVGWFETEMGQDANWQKVRKFLDGEFRRDLNNLSLYVWTARASIADDELSAGAGAELPDAFYSSTARLAQYLIAHDYFDPSEAFDWLRDFSAVSSEDLGDRRRVLASRVQQLLTRKSKLDPAGGNASLSFLTDPDKAVASLKRFLRDSPEYAALCEKYRDERKPNPDPEDVIYHGIIDEILHFDIFAHPDELELSLATAGKPVATNGRWQPADQVVKWRRSINANDTLPTICFAVWGEPDAAFQKQHFSGVTFDGEALVEFVTAYLLLEPAGRALVDHLLDTLHPDEDLKSAIEAFVAKWRKHEPDLTHVAELLMPAVAGRDAK